MYRNIKISNQTFGYTLVEIMVVMFILGIILAIFSAFAVFYLNSYSFSFEENQSIGTAQYNTNLMVREIREARISEQGGWPIIEALDNSFSFYADVNDDGRTDHVRYFLENTDLKRGVIEPTVFPISYPVENEEIKTIAERVDNEGLPVFTYYNGDWPQDQINNPLPQGSRLLATRFVSVTLRINVDPDHGSEPVELTSGVQIRSLKDNL